MRVMLVGAGGVMLLLAAAGQAWSQATQPRVPLAAEDKIVLTKPEVDKDQQTVTIPAAFWNQQMRGPVEVALCGRPSDFLHETILSVTATQDMLIKAMRDAGFHDADAWVSSVRDFPRIRGDKALLLVTVEHDHTIQTFSLDELLTFYKWNVPIGPYGWMFKGDPEHQRPATAPSKDPVTGEPLTDAGKILRDDPQVALQFQGLQHTSQSFIDLPLAYDDWCFPMMDYWRNTTVLPQAVFDSNGTMPVTLRIEKVNEEQYLQRAAAVWHDAAFKQYMLQQIPVARQIDADKKILWDLVQRLKALPAEDASNSEVFAQAAMKAAEVEKGYAALDAAWSSWAADHAQFDPKDEDIDELRQQAKLWKEHGELMKERASQLATAEEAAYVLHGLQGKPDPNGEKPQLRGQEISARSAALIAEIKQPLDKWTFEQKRLDPGDPRTDWVNGIRLQLALLHAEQVSGDAGVAYGKALETGTGDRVALESRWAQAQVAVTIAQLQVQLADVAFELSKREGIDNDPDVPSLKARQAQLQARLREAQAATQPGK
jgi:hypothetical protein